MPEKLPGTLPLIMIGAPSDVGLPPGTVPAVCQNCRNVYLVQPSTVATIARLGQNCIVACLKCIKKANLPINVERDAVGMGETNRLLDERGEATR